MGRNPFKIPHHHDFDDVAQTHTFRGSPVASCVWGLILVLWGVLALITLARNMAPGPWITGALCAIALYVIGAGLLRHAD